MRLFFNRTAFLSIAILCFQITLAEALLQDLSIQSKLPIPSIGTGYRPATIQFHELEIFAKKNGGVDCLFIGSSLVYNAINPVAFQDAYTSQTGQEITCYNFGLYNLTVSTAAPIAQLLIEQYHPELVVIGLQGWELSNYAINEYEVQFPDTAWMQYRQGQVNLQGWLIEESYLYRYLNIIPELLSPQPRRVGYATSAKFVAGYQPMIFYSPPPDSPFFSPQRDNQDAEERSVDNQEFVSFKKIVEMGQKDIKLYIVEMPTYSSQRLWREQHRYYDALNIAADYAYTHQIPFWFTSNYDLIPIEGWADFSHLHITYSILFSEWLGQQIGAAVQGKTPSLVSPPLETLPLQLPPRHGFSDSNWQAYQDYAFDLIPPNKVVFSPEMGLLSPEFLAYWIGTHIEWAADLPADQRQSLFEFLNVILDITETPPSQLKAWQSTRLPSELKDVDYLFYSATWAGWLTQEETQILNNPENYQLIASWAYPELVETYYLYHVVH